MVTPCKCPICGGRGTMPATFYMTYEEIEATKQTTAGIPTGTTICRTCNGKGILWASENYSLIERDPTDIVYK